MTNLEHALSILEDVIEKHKKQMMPVGQLLLVKSYIMSENEKDCGIRYAESVCESLKK